MNTFNSAFYMAYTSVAYTNNSMQAFGPTFENENDAWKWLHSDGIDCPTHDRIEVLEYFKFYEAFEAFYQKLDESFEISLSDLRQATILKAQDCEIPF